MAESDDITPADVAARIHSVKSGDSLYLRFQDVDGDGLIDVCDDLIIVPDVPCKGPCTPNPSAINPPWKDRNIEEPFVNEKKCYYSVTKVTPHTTIKADVNDNFEEFKKEAIDSLLNFYDKIDNVDSRKQMTEAIIFERYDLEPRPHSRLKLLYSVPFDVLYNLQPAPPEPEPYEEDEPGNVKVVFNAAQLTTQIIRVRKGLNFYGKLLKVYRSIGEGNAYYKKDRTLFNLEDYGDDGIFTTGIMRAMMNDLEAFLDSKNYRLPGQFFGIFSTDQLITKLQFNFDDYRLVSMKVWTQECGTRPVYWSSKKIKPLTRQGPWRDRTACGYFAQLPQMAAKFNARVQIPWQEFLEEFTYPAIFFDIKEQNTTKTISSCVADALEDEFKELGQDILDATFSIGDAIAYLWRKSICRGDLNESEGDDFLAGLYSADGTMDITKMYGMAQEQAFAKLSMDDNVFVLLCLAVAGSTSKLGKVNSMIAQMYKFGFNRIKVCGLFDLLMSTIQCLMGGLQLEEAMGRILLAALKSMSIENFGDMFAGLPPDKQAELTAMVEEQLKDGSFFSSVGIVPKPWEMQDVIDKERANMREDNFEGMTPTPNSQVAPPRYERTVVADNDRGAGVGQVPVENIMQAYVQALIDVYSDDYFALLDELNKFPGAQIIATIIGLLDCPHPPLLNPSFPEFIKSLIFPFCNHMMDFKLPRLETPIQYYPDFADITQAIWQIAKALLLQLAFQILMLLLVKICEIIGKAICKAIELGGSVAVGLVSEALGGPTLYDHIKKTICGPEADDKMVEDTVLDLMSQLGLGAAAFTNTDRTMQFGLDLSASVTSQELTEALLGSPSPIFLEMADHLIEYEYPEFRDAMPSRTALGRFFGNIGNLMPLDARRQLEDAASRNIWSDPDNPNDPNSLMPANPSLCATPEQIEQFKELRCQLLEGRATPEQCHEMYCNLREDTLTDLGDLSDILQNGIGNHIVNNMPPLVSEPGCDDGIFPFESPQMTAVGVATLTGDMDQLRMAYGKDMMGNGNFWNSDSQWGFMNLMLADTMGFALTSHHAKASNSKEYVNYATNLPNGGESTTGFFSFFQAEQGFSGQIGQYPYYVGEWMKRQFLNAGIPDAASTVLVEPGFYQLNSMGTDLKKTLHGEGYGFNSTNVNTGKVRKYVDYEDLQYNNLFGSLTQGVNLFMIPDFGYNTTLFSDDANDRVIITREIRKGKPVSVNGHGNGESNVGAALYKPTTIGCDLVLDFRDNAAGMRLGPKDANGFYISTNDSNGKDGGLFGMSTEWSWGYEMHLYYSDIHEDEDGNIRNRFDDNIRIDLIEKVNYGSSHLGPLGHNLTDEFTKMEPFDLPNWLEFVPIVSWAIEAVINLVAMPFTQLIIPAIRKAMLRASEEIHRIREFEFISVDDGLDVFHIEPDPEVTDWPTLSEYPNFASIKTSLPEFSPPVLLLADMVGMSPAAAKAKYDSTMNSIYQIFAEEIGDLNNEASGWLYGADYDFLTQDAIRYGVVSNGDFMPYSTTGYEEEDMVLGMSYDQYLNGDQARAIYLNPSTFGGSYTKPKLHIKPLRYTGWMGFSQVFFPESTACKPHSKDVVDFDELDQFIKNHYAHMTDDPRLLEDSECVREVPFKRIMTRGAKTGMYTLILAAIRIYASTHLFKAMGTFCKIMPKFPDNFSSIYSAYLVERIEEDFRDAPDGFWGWAQSFKDDEFWYGFLEQSVECYDFLVSAGELELPPQGGHLQAAFDAINDLQTSYAFPMRPTYTRKYETNENGRTVTRKQTVLGLWEAKMAGEAGFFQSLKGYRSDENFEGVQSVEEHAKLILQQLVNFELTKMGERLVDNMRQYGMNPKIFDLDYYIFQEMNAGNSGAGGAEGEINGRLYFAGPNQIDMITALPTPENPDPRGEGVSWPGPYHTAGGEFRIAINKDKGNEFDYADEYVGYYHGHIDEEGDVVYMVGEEHSPDDHDVLTPVDNLVSVGTEKFIDERVDVNAANAGSTEEEVARESQSDPYPKLRTEEVYIGTVPSFGTPLPAGSSAKPFAIQQYVSINGNWMSPSAAKAHIQAHDPQGRISDFFPGTLRLVKNDADIPVGITGNIGVRYGLAFYYVDGTQKLITSVEVDSLDVKVGQWNVMQPSSKLLMCLLNKLKEAPKYKLMTSYIFSLKKVTASWAIYNDFGIMSSLGEVTPGTGDHTRWLPTGLAGALAGVVLGKPAANTYKASDWLSNTPFGQVKIKPGSRAYIDKNEETKRISWDSLTENQKDAVNPIRVPWFDDDIEFDVVTFDSNKSGVTGNEGWVAYDDRGDAPFAGWWRTTWDEWDRRLLRNSVYRIKKLFKTYYYARDRRPGDDLLEGSDKPSTLWLKNLKAAMFPVPGRNMLPWWQRGRLASSPFNAKGEMCSGRD